MKFIITFGIVLLNHNTCDLYVSFMEGTQNTLQSRISFWISVTNDTLVINSYGNTHQATFNHETL